MRSKKRVVFIFYVFCLLFLVIWSKAFKLQVLDRKALLKLSDNQIFRESRTYPKRGYIYDRNGAPLALNIQTYSIFAIPKKGKFDKSYRRLSKIVPEISYKSIRKKVHTRTRYTWLARKLSLTKEQVKKIQALKGIYIDSVPKRFYPNQESASQILGFVGIDNTGLAGIEYQFDKELRGTPQVIKYVKDAKGRAIKFESQKLGDRAKNITLSLDKDLQSFAEQALKEGVTANKARKGGIGIMDVNTGEILAMANYPSFNPNNLKSSVQTNRNLSFISDPFEPGSVFKIFTVASAMEHKIARTDTNYYCHQGQIIVDGHVINEAESQQNYEWLSVRDIVKYSSNVGITKMAFDLTFPKLKQTLDKLSIGKKTGIELPAESRGIFVQSDNITPLSLSNISFGQGVATTGLQILSAYASIANGGRQVIPTILAKESRTRPLSRKQMFSKKVAKDLTQMLISVVESGTGSNAKIKYFKIAGKTSTAQKPDKAGGYDGYISGFVGFPVNVDNGFVIYVYIDDPQEEYYGNKIAAPIFKKVAQYMLYQRKHFNTLALQEKSNTEIKDIVQSKQSSLPPRTIKPGSTPNFKNLDKKSSELLAMEASVDVDHIGIGVVYRQHPQPYQKIEKDDVILLYYRPPTL